MEPVCFLMLLSATLLQSLQCLPAGRGRGLDSGGGVRRQRRDVQNVLPLYEDRMMSLPVQESDWRGRGLEQALQRLVERDQRREQEAEQQRTAYLSAVLQLLSDADRAGLINPEVELLEEDQDQELDQGPVPQDYDETGRGLSMSRPRAPWWSLVEPQLAQALLQRLDPQLSEALMNRVQTQVSGPRETDQDTLRRLVARILSSLGPSDAVMSSGRRMRRDLSDPAPAALNPAHRRSRRSLDDDSSPSDEPLLRVKRLDEDESEPRPQQQPGLQRIKRIDAEEDHGSRRRKRRAVVNYDPQILLRQVLELIRE